jgi:formylmethanofuran dehydrogenase subunit E
VAKGIDVLCGCGRHMISPNDDDSIQYRERWWKLKCVFLKVDKRMPRILRRMEKMEKEIERHRKMRLKFIRMKKYIRQVPCNYCGEQVGNRFKQAGDGILCHGCHREHGRLYN